MGNGPFLPRFIKKNAHEQIYHTFGRFQPLFSFFLNKNGGERVRLPRFAKFRSKNRKFVVSTSDDVHNGTFLSAFSLMKRGKNGPFPIPYGEKMGKKWGSFFELYISHQTAS